MTCCRPRLGGCEVARLSPRVQDGDNGLKASRVGSSSSSLGSSLSLPSHKFGSPITASLPTHRIMPLLYHYITAIRRSRSSPSTILALARAPKMHPGMGGEILHICTK